MPNRKYNKKSYKKQYPPVLLDQYKSLQKDIDNTYFNLKLLEWDHKLITKYGFRIHFVVDFHELYLFAFPFDEAISQKINIFSKKTVNFISNKQIARSFLFYGLKTTQPPVLLPPYDDELREKLRGCIQTERAGGFPEANLQLRYIQNFAASIEDFKQNANLKYAFEEYKRTRRILKGYLEDIFLFLIKNFRDLLYTISGLTTNGFVILRNLIAYEKSGVEFVFERWPEYLDLIEKIMKDKNESEWYKRFREIRSKPDQDHRDSKALDLVFCLNKELNSRKEVVLIVTDAESTEEVLRQSGNEETIPDFYRYGDGVIELKRPHVRLPVLRNLNTFLFYLLYKGASDKETLTNIKMALTRLSEYRRLEVLLGWLVRKCKRCKSRKQEAKCPQLVQCKLAKEKLKYFIKERVKLENIRLAIKGAPYLKNFIKPETTVRYLRETVKIILKLIDASTSKLKKDAFHEEEEIYRRLEKERKIFVVELLKYFSNLKPKELEIELASDLTLLILTRDFLKFKNPQIISIFKRLRDVFNIEDIVDFHKRLAIGIIKLVELSSNEKLGLDRFLLLSALLMVYNKFKESLSIASEVIEKENLSQKDKIEFYYINLLVQFRWIKKERKWGNYFGLIRLADRTIRSYPNDSRLYHLRGRMIGAYKEEVPSRIEFSWDDVVGCYEKAYELEQKSSMPDNYLIAVILNNWAWFLLRRRKVKDLDEAKAKFKELRQILPYNEWLPEYFHTNGITQLEIGREYKIEHLSKAKHCFVLAKNLLNTCIKRAGELRYPKKYISTFIRDLETVKKELESLGDLY